MYSLIRKIRVPMRSFVTQDKSKDIKVALLLSGCGVYDGSEITEAVSCLISLGKHKAQYKCFSFNREQFDVVDHTDGSKLKEKRNMLQESARIARGDIHDITKLNAEDYHALVIPGGFGAAKNFCSFAVDAEKFKVDPTIEKIIHDFHRANKPIAACCIAPIILAKVFGTSNKGPGAKITLGNEGEQWSYAGTIKVAEKLGNTLEKVDIDKVTIDEKNNIVTTPAYMKNASPYEVYSGIDRMISETIKRIKH